MKTPLTFPYMDIKCLAPFGIMMDEIKKLVSESLLIKKSGKLISASSFYSTLSSLAPSHLLITLLSDLEMYRDLQYLDHLFHTDN